MTEFEIELRAMSTAELRECFTARPDMDADALFAEVTRRGKVEGFDEVARWASHPHPVGDPLDLSPSQREVWHKGYRYAMNDVAQHWNMRSYDALGVDKWW